MNISRCCPWNQTGAKTVMFTGVEFQIKHMKGFRYGIFETFFFSFMEWNGCISHLFFTVGFILSLLYYFPAPVICYTSQWEFNLNPTAQYCFYKGYLNKKLFRITHILHTIWSVILFIFASPREVVPKAIKSASNVGELWLWAFFAFLTFIPTNRILSYNNPTRICGNILFEAFECIIKVFIMHTLMHYIANAL